MEDTASKITMTESAIAEVKRLIGQTDFDTAIAGVRVGVKGGGCSGFTYTLNFDKASADGDEIFEFDGVRLFCDPKSLLYLNGITLEYTTGLQGKGFQFINPNATGTCGCGDSFSV
ncbi:MAG: iron-sulfur cluster assembly accessory protein [Planctomycetota bacterium]|jgi:iron-sulfur cluster assembly protein|nr:iron-sulfur cluster assembly accessory protein [Planctomycetota bacterium]